MSDLDTILGLDFKERLRRLDKEDLADIFKRFILTTTKDHIIQLLGRDVSLSQFLEHTPKGIREALLFEPKSEREMKTAVGNWLKQWKWTSVKEEIPIVEESVADIVGFKEGGHFGQDLVCVVELKRASASTSDLDRGFRQVNDFLRGADLVYLAVTPLLLWSKTIEFFRRRLEPLGAGLIAVDGQQVFPRDLLTPKRSKYIQRGVREDLWKHR